MNRLPLLLLLLYSLVFFACNPDPDEPSPFTVSGTIVSDDGFAVEGAKVNSVVDTGFSDMEGRYTVRAHPQGSLFFSKPGFEPWTETVGNRDSIDVTLLEIPESGETQFDVSFQKSACDGGDTLDLAVVEVKDFGEGTGTMTWTRDKTWVLKNRVFVNEGQVLHIQPGTIIKAAGGQGPSASALIVARGGQLFAEGTPELPVIFTSVDDDILRYSDGSFCRSSGLSANDRGRWGGLVILGRASLNSASGETPVEGVPTSEPRAMYGGTDDADNSGILRYVSIRHAGTQIGPGNEINALTLAGVGRGTSIEYVETFASADDGFEFFGGTVDTRFLVSAFPADDAFDYDEGWRGRNQFWFAIQDENSDRGGEHDGGTDPKDGLPFATPIMANVTYHGPSMAGGHRLISFSDNAGGEYHQSIFMNYALGVEVEYTGAGEQDAFRQFEDGRLVFQGNLFHDIGNEPLFSLRNASLMADNEPEVASAAQSLSSYFADPANGNVLANPELDPFFIPSGNGPAAQGGNSNLDDSFFENTDFKGCFRPSEERWLDGWTRVGEEL